MTNREIANKIADFRTACLIVFTDGSKSLAVSFSAYKRKRGGIGVNSYCPRGFTGQLAALGVDPHHTIKVADLSQVFGEKGKSVGKVGQLAEALRRQLEDDQNAASAAEKAREAAHVAKRQHTKPQAGATDLDSLYSMIDGPTMVRMFEALQPQWFAPAGEYSVPGKKCRSGLDTIATQCAIQGIDLLQLATDCAPQQDETIEVVAEIEVQDLASADEVAALKAEMSQLKDLLLQIANR